MQRIDIEYAGIKTSSMHIEAVLSGINALSTSAFANDREFMLKGTHRFAINNVLRQTIIHINMAKH